MCHAFFIFVGTEVIEGTFVIGRSSCWQIFEWINVLPGLGVSVAEGLQVLGCPKGTVHVFQGLGMLELVLDLVVQECNAVFGLVVLFKEVGCLGLQVVEESLGSFFWPFHEVKVVMDIWSVTVYKALGCQLVNGLWRTFGLDHQALFWAEEGSAAMVLSCPWSVIGEASWAQIVSLFAGSWFDIGGPMVG